MTKKLPVFREGWSVPMLFLGLGVYLHECEQRKWAIHAVFKQVSDAIVQVLHQRVVRVELQLEILSQIDCEIAAVQIPIKHNLGSSVHKSVLQ